MRVEPPPPAPPGPTQPDPPDPRLGTVLQGRYRIQYKIAAGAMGVVYKGERLQLGRPVAVKFLHPWIASQKTFLSRFENEARAMSRLAHPHCVSVIDFGVEGSPYLVMDFVTGQTLRDALGQGPQPPARALHVVRQLLAGLGHAHAQGIVHRDLKPDNLILSDEEGLEDHLRILDFGLAKLRDGPAMTAGLAVGTPSYMSPEQTGAAGSVDARSDLYAVGVLLFEMLAGRKPFEANHIGELILMHRETAVPPLRQAVPGGAISAELEAVVGKAMAKRQDDRYQSAAELAAALEATPEARTRADFRARGGAAPPLVTATGSVPDTLPAPAGAARAGALPPPPATGRPPARPPEPTIVDTATAVMRRHDLPLPRTAGAAEGPGARAGSDAPETAAGAGVPRSEAAVRLPFTLDRRHLALGAGVVGCVALAILVGVIRHRSPDPSTATAGAPLAPPSPAALASGRASPASARAAPAGATPTPTGAPTSGLAGSRVEEARRLRHDGEWEQALAVLGRARREQPADADVDYLLAGIYLEHHRPLEGLASAQSAIRKNPALKSDGDLINAVIESLASDKTYDRSQAFLHGLGSTATPFLKEAARHHASAKVRQRAAEVLQSSGGTRSASGSASRPSSSVFHR
ncbi:MAG TPA: serine/threonine-protein kinase [Polyangia bacterium]|nr:serine/threonine-protein kinase [Polyangia bacterium]